jgi:hypothetical protein
VIASAAFDALVGLAFPDIAVDKVTPFLTQAFNKELIADSVFSFWLCPPPITSLHSPLQIHSGELIFGGYDPHHYTGQLHYIPLSNASYWAVALDSLAFSDHTFASFRSLTAVFDSGTSLLVVHEHLATLLNSKLPCMQIVVQQQVACIFKECPDMSAMPDLVLEMGNRAYTLRPHQYIRRHPEMSDIYGRVICVSGLMGMVNIPPKLVILGDLFLQAYHTVFDYGNKRVGLAPSVSCL